MKLCNKVIWTRWLLCEDCFNFTFFGPYTRISFVSCNNVYNKQSKETEAPLILECALNTSATKCIGMKKGSSENRSLSQRFVFDTNNTKGKKKTNHSM